MLASDALYFTQFLPAVSQIFRYSHIWVKPKFSAELFSVYMHMSRFSAKDPP